MLSKLLRWCKHQAYSVFGLRFQACRMAETVVCWAHVQVPSSRQRSSCIFREKTPILLQDSAVCLDHWIFGSLCWRKSQNSNWNSRQRHRFVDPSRLAQQVHWSCDDNAPLVMEKEPSYLACHDDKQRRIGYSYFVSESPLISRKLRRVDKRCSIARGASDKFSIIISSSSDGWEMSE